MPLTIEVIETESNDWTVRMGDRYTDHLTWDEMLGQVAYITCPKESAGGVLFSMLTAEERAEKDARLAAYFGSLQEKES